MVDINFINTSHIDGVKLLADQNRNELGFITRQKFEEIVQDQRGIVATEDDSVVGFVTYRHRKIDMQTTLSEICVRSECRGQHIGTYLIQALINDCRQKSRDYIQLKCPTDLPANNFYEKLGFKLHQVEVGKKRQLNVWRLAISSHLSE